MIVLLIALILFLQYRLEQTRDAIVKKEKENKFTIAVLLYIVCLAALRADDVGADTGWYVLDYEKMNLCNSVDGLLDRYTSSYIVYYGLSKVFSIIGFPYQVWFAFVEGMYVISMYKMINRFSYDKLFSVLIFVTTGLFSFSLAGMKQTLSMSFMMFSFIFFIKKRYLISSLFVITCYFTHPSALIFLAAFPIYYLRNTRWLITVSLISVVIVLLTGSLFLSTMVDVLGNEHFEIYLEEDDSFTSVMIIFYISTLVMSLLCYKEYANMIPSEANLSLSYCLIALGLQSLSSINPNMFRLALLYTPFMMILYPNSCYFAKDGKFVKTIIMASIIFYYLYTGRNSDYMFFWQQSQSVLQEYGFK